MHDRLVVESAGGRPARSAIRRFAVLLPTEQSLTVIDYKTDPIPPDLVPARAETYRGPISIYREALERITGKPMDAAFLVFLAPRVLFRV